MRFIAVGGGGGGGGGRRFLCWWESPLPLLSLSTHHTSFFAEGCLVVATVSVVLITGKEGALIAVDGRLFHTGIQRAIKSTCRHQQKGRVKGRMSVMLWNFVVVKVLRQNSLGESKATK